MKSIQQPLDEFGIPVLRFHYKWSDYERNQAKHMHDTFEEIIHNFGGIPLGEKPTSKDFGLLAPGMIIHEVGTTRMGKDPKNSVTNEFQQLHDVDNVFITDAGPFVSQADKNPTWTIMALAWRSSDYLIEQLKKTEFIDHGQKRKYTIHSTWFFSKFATFRKLR